MPNDFDDDLGDSEEEPDIDWDAIVGDSNAGAYRLTEARSGPPLSYVAEKLRNAVEQIHYAYAQLDVDDEARIATHAAFHYAIIAHLALNNMLALAGDHQLVTRLLAMSSKELDRWLDTIDAEGSVTG